MTWYGSSVCCSISILKAAACTASIEASCECMLSPSWKIRYLPSRMPLTAPIGWNVWLMLRRSVAFFSGPIIVLYVLADVSRKPRPMAMAKIATRNIVYVAICEAGKNRQQPAM